MEFALLAIGGGLIALSKSKNVAQMENAAKNISRNMGNSKGLMDNITKLVQSHEHAGGFKEQMDKAEALKILGCPLDAEKDQINKHARVLQLANHPDRGGSPYISNKVNNASKSLTIDSYWIILRSTRPRICY